MTERPPQVLVVDDDLPDGKGAELVRELRRDPRMRNVRVLFCTAAEPARRRGPTAEELRRVLPVVRELVAEDFVAGARALGEETPPPPAEPSRRWWRR